MVRFRQSRKFDFMYDSENRVIYYPYLEEYEDLFSILHEMRHFRFHHENSDELVNISHLLEEIEAWAFVFWRVKKEYHIRLMKLALECLESYIDSINLVWSYKISLTEVKEKLKYIIEKGE